MTEGLLQSHPPPTCGAGPANSGLSFHYPDVVTDPGQRPITLRRHAPPETPAADADADAGPSPAADFDPRSPLLRSHARAFEVPRKSLRTYLSEPGGWIVVLVVGGAGLVVWLCCALTALLLLNGLPPGATPFGIALDSFLGVILTAAIGGTMLFGIILLGWLFLGGSRAVVLAEGGLIDRLIQGLLRREEEVPVLDEGPALLARKRGNHAEAARLYRDWIREHPDRLELRFALAEVEHQGLGDREAALRGYRDFLRRLRTAKQSPSKEAASLVPLAEARIADLERPPEPPPERRRIKI